jgi:hypothetical protein
MKIAAGDCRGLKKTRYCRNSSLTYNILYDNLFPFFCNFESGAEKLVAV